MTFTFNAIYEYLPTPRREEYTFTGWSDVNGEEITDNTIVRITANQILHANWAENVISQESTSLSQIGTPTNYAEIVFEKKDMSEDEIKKF